MLTDGMADSVCGSLTIRLLGEIELRRDGARVTLPASRRTRALLAYLVMSEGAVARSSLCDLLWDGPDDPRAALRWSLSKLRPLLDDASHKRIVASRTHVAFDAADACIDTAKVQSLLASGAESMPLSTLEEAATLLRGEFISGLDLPSCYRFHNWCVAQRESFGHMRKTVLRALVAKMNGDEPAALQRGRELVEADPLDEAAHATLIGLLHGAGRHTDAEHHHDYARALMRRELGASASATLDDLIRHLRLGQRAMTRVDESISHLALRNSVEHQQFPSPPPLVGRTAECTELDTLLSAPPTSPKLTLLSGEPGIGKTRLLDYFEKQASISGAVMLRGRCYQAEMIRPYGIWIDALRAVAANDVIACGEPLAPFVSAASAAMPGTQPDQGDREQFFEGVMALLERLSCNRRLAIVLDDLQWLDEASAALLHFALRRLGGQLIVFVATARIAEVDDNPWARMLLQSLSRDGKLNRVPLRPLLAADVETIVAALGNNMSAGRALRESGGNPLYLVELTRAATPERGDWPPSIATLIEERLTVLDHPTRNLLCFAATIGRSFAPEQLAELTDKPLQDILASLTGLERRGLIAPNQSGFDFAHDLVRETVYQTLSQPHRRAMHHQIARQLLAASRYDPQLHGAVVHHATLAEDPLMTARACVEASHHCLRVFAVAEALAVAERGIAHARAIAPGSERVRLNIQLLTARLVAAACSGDRRPAALEEELEQAIREAEALSLHADVVQALHSLSWLTQQANEVERTRLVTIRAETAARRADAITRCKQLANTGRCLLELERDLSRARSVLHEAGAMAQVCDLRVVELMWGEALLARTDGNIDFARARMTDAVAQARLTGDHWREYQCLVWLATIDLECGAFEEVSRLTDEITAAAMKLGDSGAPYANVIGEIARLRLAGDDPHSHIFHGLDGLRQADDKRHLCRALNEAALLFLDWSWNGKAGIHATEALSAASALHSTTEMIVATAILRIGALGRRCGARRAPHRVLVRIAERSSTGSPERRGNRASTNSVPDDYNGNANAYALALTDERSKWRCEMTHVVVERSFPMPQSDEDLAVAEDRLAPCSELYGVVWKRSVVSSDRRHMICEYEAPDAETVRKVQKEAGAVFDHVWSGEIIGG
ncbi:hypothetical protein LMG28727_07049 [Paraburkholderia kirstenboschensis]|uniref:nickel-binding protein n=1 Tax=Paraburkholderia kirstenboschensis TaxID=1245436 RepID=UPI000B0EB232|nr:nickel-binding protein [Paraburkholderia kirstenboschensis]CAD6560143.1 hypothetical protein LMG28727_07049 [Paraburkholderia kirstenboschensis]